jgi:hypothetical protein
MEAITMEHKDLPFAATSAAEEGLSTASGTKTPIKCFGCDRALQLAITKNIIHGKTSQTRTMKQHGTTSMST